MSHSINPDLRKQAEAMFTPEQIAEYEKKGEAMYGGSVDYNTSQIMNNDTLLLESTAYILEALKSGLHADQLSPIEIKLMVDNYGDDWKTKFGY
jgi:hypothetical protein